MIKQTSTIVRLGAIVVMVLSLVAVATEPAVAKREPPSLTSAQQVREMVLKHREEVLARIAAIMSGKKDAAASAQDEPGAPDEAEEASEPEEPEAESAEPEEGEAEDAEAEGEEAEGEEVEDAEADGGEVEDEEVSELPETGAGQPRGADGAGSTLMAIFGAIAAAGLSLRRIHN